MPPASPTLFPIRGKQCLPALVSVEAEASLEVSADLGHLPDTCRAPRAKVLRDCLSHAQPCLVPAFVILRQRLQDHRAPALELVLGSDPDLLGFPGVGGNSLMFGFLTLKIRLATPHCYLRVRAVRVLL